MSLDDAQKKLTENKGPELGRIESLQTLSTLDVLVKAEPVATTPDADAEDCSADAAGTGALAGAGGEAGVAAAGAAALAGAAGAPLAAGASPEGGEHACSAPRAASAAGQSVARISA